MRRAPPGSIAGHGALPTGRLSARSSRPRAIAADDEQAIDGPAGDGRRAIVGRDRALEEPPVQHGLPARRRIHRVARGALREVGICDDVRRVRLEGIDPAATDAIAELFLLPPEDLVAAASPLERLARSTLGHAAAPARACARRRWTSPAPGTPGRENGTRASTPQAAIALLALRQSYRCRASSLRTVFGAWNSSSDGALWKYR